MSLGVHLNQFLISIVIHVSVWVLAFVLLWMIADLSPEKIIHKKYEIYAPRCHFFLDIPLEKDDYGNCDCKSEEDE